MLVRLVRAPTDHLRRWAAVGFERARKTAFSREAAIHDSLEGEGIAQP